MAVRRLHPAIDVKLINPVRMWRDDLNEVATWLGETGGGDLNIELTAAGDKYKIDSVDDLANLDVETIDSIKFTKSDAIEFELGGSSNFLTTFGTDFRVRAIADQIEKLCRQKCRFKILHHVIVTPQTALISALVFVGLLVLAIVQRTSFPGWAQLLPAFLGGTVGPLLVLAITEWLVHPFRSLIFSKTRAEAPLFWQRKRDDLIINGLSLLLGGIIGYWINTLMQ